MILKFSRNIVNNNIADKHPILFITHSIIVEKPEKDMQIEMGNISPYG